MLPRPSHHPPSTASSSSALAAQAVASALSNPYSHFAHSAYPQTSHYAQAYAQYHHGQGVTTEGYTLSATYVPGTQYRTPGFSGEQRQPIQRPQTHGHASQAHWYQPGTCRCTKQNCTFVGSKKAVEIHMMDRHLIYPPGWDARKKKQDWDADPSLKGKPIPIQGTNIKLDTPEAIAAWIAERRKRFPTAENVQDKQRKKEEALARGQLPFDEGAPRRKRPRTDDGPSQFDGGRGRARGGSRGRGRGGGGRGRGRGVGGHGPPVSNASATPRLTGLASLPPKPSSAPAPPGRTVSDEETGSDSDSDAAPEEVSSKAPPVNPSEPSKDEDVPLIVTTTPSVPSTQPARKPPPRLPRRPLHNPFAARPSLLRNLLLPEIRMTVSNLSQAIRFLVDNEFLENVELKPGQGDEKKIEVISETPASAENSNPA